MKKITIIGAGIGGLTTAIALTQNGFDVEIFEASKEFKNAGSGINLAINAMQIYKELGIYDDILLAANYTNSMNALNKELKVLTSAKFHNFENKYNVKTVAIHRASLHKILLNHIGNTKIHLNKKLKSLEQHNEIINLSFEDGTSYNTTIVIGADGIHSNVRKSIFNNTALRDAEQVCWRGISNAIIDKKHTNELNEIWGRGNRFGFVHISSNEIYWFALINKDQFITKDADLVQLFSDYPHIIKNIISETTKKDILCNEIWDLKPIDKWYSGNVCLIGDAAHATTPNLGQGACQAIESAMALSICLKQEENIETAFSKFQLMRKQKANYVTQTSWILGKIAQSNNLVGCFLRNFIVQMTPKFITDKQSDRILKLNF